MPYVNVQDQKAANTQGGDATSGAWRTRDLNTLHADTHGIVLRLSSNQLYLPAGAYTTRIRAPAFQVSSHQARLQNISLGTTIMYGAAMYSNSSAAYATTDSVIAGRFVLNAATFLEVQHQVQVTNTGDGFGVAANFASIEVYTVAEFWREIP